MSTTLQNATPRNLTLLQVQIAPSWVPDADTRGTWNLLYSCVFTLALCVWTAIHLNVPGQGESSIRQICRKAKWVVAAIFAPELAVFTAWYQWYWARQICQRLTESSKKAKGDSKDESATGKRRFPKLQKQYCSIASCS